MPARPKANNSPPKTPKQPKGVIDKKAKQVQASQELQNLVSKVKDEYNNIPYIQRVLAADKQDQAKNGTANMLPDGARTPKTPLMRTKTPSRRIYTRQGYAGGEDDPNADADPHAVDHRPFRSQDMLNFEDTVIKDLQKALRLSQASRPRTGASRTSRASRASHYASDDDDDDDDDAIPDETPSASFALEPESDSEPESESAIEEVKKSRAQWVDSIDDVCIYGNDSRASSSESDQSDAEVVEEQLEAVEIPAGSDLQTFNRRKDTASPPRPKGPPASPIPAKQGKPTPGQGRSRYSEVIRNSRATRINTQTASPRGKASLSPSKYSSPTGGSPRNLKAGGRR